MAQRTAQRRASRLQWTRSAPWACIAVILFVPVALYVRRHLGLPMPDPVPSSARANSDLSFRYWGVWAVAWLVLIAPGAAASLTSRARQAGLGHLVVTGVMGGILAAGMVWLEYSGSAPK